MTRKPEVVLGVVGAMMLALGVGAATSGLSTQQARTATPSTVDGTQSSNGEGSSLAFARADHTHATNFLSTLTGAIARTFASKFSDTVSVKDFGVLGNGTDETTAISNAVSAANTAGATLYFPCGTYLSTAAITIANGASLRGAGRTCTILSFSGATDGVVVSDATVQPKDWTITDLTITTSNATAGKALNVTVTTRGAIRAVVRDVTVAKSGSGLWTHCLYSANWQVSAIYGLHNFQSCAIGMHFDNFSDALNVYDYEFVGSSGAGSINRGIEIVGDADIRFYGGTLQGYFAQSLININTTTKGQKFYGLHFENTNASPSDGADVVGVGTNVNTTFSGIQGGTFNIATSGVWRNFVLENSESGITIGAGCVSCAVLNVRGTSLVDNSTATLILGASTSTGNALASKLPTQLLAHNTSTIPAAVNHSSAALVLGNGALLDWVDSGGVAREVLQMSAANQVLAMYPSASTFAIRNSTPTNKFTVTDSKITALAGFATTRTAPTYGTTIAIDAGLGNEFVVTPTDGVAFTVANPTSAAAGQRITVRVVNTFGVLGALTFGTAYKASAWTQPANGFSRAIDFQYNGAAWVEASRTPADVPN